MTEPGPDTGEADPRLAAALATGDPLAVRAALLVARVLVPIVATSADIDADTHAAELAVPRLVGADGRLALPVFSSYASLRAWRSDARPVPMPGLQAVAAAVEEGCAAVILDVAGPDSHVFEADAATL
jgi:SseB protein N-terminal domain